VANLKIFKFGGASVKDAEGVKRVAEILSATEGDIIVVVSAMGKTTNALEKLVPKLSAIESEKLIGEIEEYHLAIARAVKIPHWHSVNVELERDFHELRLMVDQFLSDNYDERYDHIVSMGEIMSTHIVSGYLKGEGIANEWIDARNVIMTDDTHRDAKVDFKKTQKQIVGMIHESSKGIVVTQGFIGKSDKQHPVTLGREGSDYTAAIIAYCTDAESVTIWKDVPGVLNADPKKFVDTVKLDHISYQDAIELAYYGATVIHPKTIKPLQNKNIPLFVKPFGDHTASGTIIDNDSTPLPVPCYISKTNQVLLSLSPKDFSFIAEENLSLIFDCFAKHHVKVNMMQHSAINFSVCIDNNDWFVRADPRVRPDATPHGTILGSTHGSTPTAGLLDELRDNYRVLYNENVELFTIRYYDQPTIDKITKGRNVLLEQRSRYTVQLVVK
jgi:aspartate kinase